MTVMVREAERGHSAQVQRRSWAAGAAAAYATRRDVTASTVGALRHLEPLRTDSGVDGSMLLPDLIKLSHVLPWRPSARVDDGGRDVALVDLFECIDIDLAGAGLMLLGPGHGYPEHQHRPAEVYLILHGSRRWKFGGSDKYVKVDRGQVISNSANDLHGIESGDDLMLALWVLMDDRY